MILNLNFKFFFHDKLEKKSLNNFKLEFYLVNNLNNLFVKEM